MTDTTVAGPGAPGHRKPLRVWPGAALAVLLVLTRYVAPVVVPWTFGFGMIGGMVLTLAIVAWWLIFSRAPWPERLGAIVLMVLAVVATLRVVHPSISNGMMGLMLPVYAAPVLGLALVAWAFASRNLSAGLRRASMVASIALACGAFTLLRTDGVTGESGSLLRWRWTPTAEERLLADARHAPLPAPTAAPAAAAVEAAPAPDAAAAPDTRAAPRAAEPVAVPAAPAAPADPTPEHGWHGFRGSDRDGVVRGVRIETDWKRKPPAELWRRPIGPGWSSFAVGGHLVYTQEQRGDDEIVAAYHLATGEPVWMHRDPARFWESNAGAGPRGTPTLSNGRVYTHGATGIVNVLDARSGAVVWSRNAASDTGAELPDWGFASSPLVVEDVVIVAASGRLVAYDLGTGQPRWVRATGGGGYSSPHLATVGGTTQVLLLSGGGVSSVAPADGTMLWQHAWQPGASIVQPALPADGDVLIAGGDMMGGIGLRRIAVARGPAGWTAEERWTSRGLKPYFNDFVVHEGHAFGFDGSILSCIDLADGARKWKGGRYGNGQLLLLADQDLLLVLSEEGELALVGAGPEGYAEVARFKAIEGKTWNHPVLVGDVLLVRNGEEMAAFRMSLVAGR